jgi:heterodisulfide reductase subunit B
MKHYSYFPGCSSEATGVAYGISTQAICEPLEMELSELEDWNCCGSTPYGSTDELEAVCIATRNLALAEEKGLDLVTPCSSCYLTLNSANSNLKLYPELKDNVDRILAAAGLKYRGTVRVRHLAEAILNDIGLEAIESNVVNRLDGLKVAPYYGCQLVRPELGFDDPENPQSLDRLVESLGAEPTPFPLKSRCCGGSLMISEPDIALGLVRKLLESASANGAECIIAACPLCQTNLDVYQGMVNARFKTKFEIPVLFFTQLMGLAFGINGKALGLDKGVISAKRVLKPFQVVAK